MVFFRFLFNEWSNVIYVVPLGIAICYFTISFLLGGGFHDSDVDAHVDMDAHADIHADVHADVDAHADVHADGDADAHSHDLIKGDETEYFSDGDAHHPADAHIDSPGLMAKIIVFMGVGKVPLSLIWSMFFITWGISGITCNTLLYVLMGPSIFYKISWFASIPVAFVAATALTKGVVLLWIKFLPTHEPTASKPEDLVGSRGSVISESVTDDYGRARIKDAFGFSLDIFCKRHPTCRKKLKHGDSIIVIDLAPGQNYYSVGPFESE